MTEETTLTRESALPPEGNRAFRIYLAGMTILFFVFYLAAFVHLRLPKSGSMFFHDLDYAFNHGGDNADILVFGESSAMYGANPVQIQSALNLKAITFPNTFGSLIVDGDIELQSYLKTNKRPKLIVFHLAAWNLNYSHKTILAKLYDGEVMLIRQGTARQILGYAVSHPIRLLQFPFLYYAVLEPPHLKENFSHRNGPSRTEVNRGFKPNLDRPLLNSSCVLPASITMQGVDTARELLNKYRDSADKVMVYVAPVPACKGTETIAADSSYGDIPASPPKVMAPENFVSDTYYTHITGSSSGRATQALIDAILPVLASDSASRTPSVSH